MHSIGGMAPITEKNVNVTQKTIRVNDNAFTIQHFEVVEMIEKEESSIKV